ncbi:MAG: alanine--glyoxylate aminotransferase family protein [Alphaproteobacteria bacterium]|nr:alanine--glyoxylate aminotransferase family protein [Alphaproteobacteria bacterium]
MAMKSFSPPTIRLMGPGPSKVSERVLAAMARPTIGHLDPEFIRLMDEIGSLLRTAMRTENDLTFPVSAPGSAGMETCLVNLLEPGDTAVVCINGVFGGRMKEVVERAGATAVVVNDEWGAPVTPDKVEAALQENPQSKLVAFVHAETSTGALSDAQQICRIAKNHGVLVVVDAVTSLAGVPLEVDRWGIDAVYSGSQKCLSCPPGLSPVSLNKAALACVEARKTPVQSWFLDLSLVAAYWQGDGARAYHHTAPVNAMYALHESLIALHEEGLEASWARHERESGVLQEGLSNLGFEFLVDKKYRLPQLLSIRIPEFVDDEAQIRRHFRNAFSLEIGAGLGPLAGKVWRIGLMGAGANRDNIDACLSALASIFET